MTKIIVDPDELRNEANVFLSARVDLEQIILGLRRSVDTLRGLYDGQLHSRLDGLTAQVQGKATEFQSRFNELSEYLNKKGVAFEAADSTNESGTLLLLSGLGGLNSSSSVWWPDSTFMRGHLHESLNSLWLLGGFGFGALSNWVSTFSPFSWSSEKSGTIPFTPVVKPQAGFNDLLLAREQELNALGISLLGQYNGHTYAPGTFNGYESDFYSAKPVRPPIVNNMGERNPKIYTAVLNQFGVESNPRYKAYKTGTTDTYCNILVWDATSALGAEIPHWVDTQGEIPVKVGEGYELDANGVIKWLKTHGDKYGWQPSTAEEAQAHANKGYPAVAVRPDSIGHVAMVRPGDYSATEGPTITQAGATNFNSTFAATGFGSRLRLKEISYYIHD